MCRSAMRVRNSTLTHGKSASKTSYNTVMAALVSLVRSVLKEKKLHHQSEMAFEAF